MKTALPPLSATVVRAVDPSMKVTVPVGVPVMGATPLTVAVKVRAAPYTDGLFEETTLMVLALGVA